MVRRIGMVLSAVVVALATVGSGVAHAAPQPVFGTQRCTLTGREMFKPAFSDGGTGAAITAKLFGRLSNCTGTTGVAGVTITGGMLRASGTAASFSNACSALTAEGLPGLHGMIRWKAAGGTVQASTLDISNGSATIGAAITLESPSPGPAPSEGDSFITGSYGPSGFLGTTIDVVDLHLVADETPSQFAAACAARHGLTSFHFSGVNGRSAVSLLPHPPGMLTVAPNTGLVDGQQVTVTGDDFAASNAAIWQCPSGVVQGSLSSCGAQNPSTATPDEVSEHFTSSIRVLRAQPRMDNVGTLDCSAPHACVIVAFAQTIHGPNDLIEAPIELGAPSG
jgi:hypothetical protein